MTTENKPDIIQSFDIYEDRIYAKIVPGFFGSHTRIVRVDSAKTHNEWKIECKEMPDKIFVNGKEYKLTEIHHDQ